MLREIAVNAGGSEEFDQSRSDCHVDRINIIAEYHVSEFGARSMMGQNWRIVVVSSEVR